MDMTYTCKRCGELVRVPLPEGIDETFPSYVIATAIEADRLIDSFMVDICDECYEDSVYWDTFNKVDNGL